MIKRIRRLFKYSIIIMLLYCLPLTGYAADTEITVQTDTEQSSGPAYYYIEALVPLKQGNIIVVEKKEITLEEAKEYQNGSTTTQSSSSSTITVPAPVQVQPTAGLTNADTSLSNSARSLSSSGKSAYSMEGKGNPAPVSIVTPQQTEDAMRIRLWLVMAILSAVGLIISMFLLLQKEDPETSD